MGIDHLQSQEQDCLAMKEYGSQILLTKNAKGPGFYL
jgi:hypothetical protein